MGLTVDISHVGQGTLSLSTFQAWAAAGVTDVVIKTGGADDGIYKDPAHDTHVANARAAGLKVHHYWFTDNRTDMASQADYFVSYAAPQNGDSMWWDVEGGNAPSASQVVEGSARVRAHGYPTPGFYGSQSILGGYSAVGADGSPLWIASYGANNGSPSTTPRPSPWGGYTWWQYTSVGRLPGYGGNLDLNQSGSVPANIIGGAQVAGLGDDEMQIVYRAQSNSSDGVIVAGGAYKQDQFGGALRQVSSYEYNVMAAWSDASRQGPNKIQVAWQDDSGDAIRALVQTVGLLQWEMGPAGALRPTGKIIYDDPNTADYPKVSALSTAQVTVDNSDVLNAIAALPKAPQEFTLTGKASA